MTSASRTVEIRCETMIEVRSRITPAQARQNLLFGVGVDGRERIVQDQDARIHHDRAGQGRPLLLSAGQGDAALPDHRVIAFREIVDILVQAGDRCSGADALVPLG